MKGLKNLVTVTGKLVTTSMNLQQRRVKKQSEVVLY